MATWLSRLHRLVWLALAVAFAGLALLLVTAWIMFLTTSAGDLVAAYRAGEEPWTSIGVALALAGATAGIILGATATILRWDLVRIVLLVPVAMLGFAWWAAALGLVGFPDFAGPDPIGFAFGFPLPAAIGLLLPAAAVAVLALSADPERLPPVRLRPVHDEPPARWPDPDKPG
jgi:hypothetical protein